MTNVIGPDFKDCLSVASFWRPARIVEPHFWIEHIPFAFWLIGALRPRTVVELGTQSGNSFFTFCQAAAQHGTQSRLTAIDTWQGDKHTGAYSEDIFMDVSRYRDINFVDSATLIRSTFDAAREKFATGSIDLLHIDGLHTYDGVRHDFESWLDTVSDRGVILFHDIAVRNRAFGVWRLWEELSAQYPAFSFVHGNGLGVLAVGHAIPEELRQLFHLPESSAGMLRMIYHRLGQSIIDWEREAESLRHRLLQIETSRSWKIARLLADARSTFREGRSSS